MPRGVPNNPLDYNQGLAIGSDYSDEEREFLREIDRYKRRRHRPHPTWREVLALVHRLGYRRPGFPDPDPDRVLGTPPG